MSEGSASGVREEVHAGKRIVVVDLTGCTEEQYQPALAQAAEHIRHERPHSVLLATIVEDPRFSATAAEQLRAYAEAARAQLRAHAVVGITEPFARALLDSVKPPNDQDTTDFPDLASAKDWLVAHA